MNIYIRTTSDEGRGGYYYANGQRVELVPEPRVFSLKMGPGRSSLSPEALDILRERTDPILFIEHKGIKVYETDAETTQRALRILNEEDAVSFATPAFRRSPSSDELIFVTNEFLVQFKPDVTRQQIDEINAKRGTWIVEELGYASNAFKLSVWPNRSGTSAIEMANLYYEQEPTRWAHPVTVRRMAIRQMVRIAPSVEHAEERVSRLGEYLSEQWHLENGHTKVIDAWSIAGAPNN